MLSLPKCASTSMVKAVAGQAEMVLRINPKLKHINCAQFHELMVPVLRKGGYQRKDYEVVSLFREPVEWLESWWRYRKRPALHEENSRRYTGDQTFEEFALDYLERKQKVRGRPARFIAMGDDLDIGVDRLFALERPDAWQSWITDKLGSRRHVRHRQRLHRAAGAGAAPGDPGPTGGVLRTGVRHLLPPARDRHLGAAEGLCPYGLTYDEARPSSATARVTIRSISSSQVGRSSITPTT